MSCSILINELQHAIEKEFNHVLRKQNTTMSQARVLSILLESQEKQITLKELERKLKLAQSVTAGLVKRLEEKHHIESFGSASDKRIKIVKITPEGEKQCRNTQATFMKLEKKFLVHLNDDDVELFKSFLKQALQTFQD